jgi:hypothetical protein
MGEREHDGRDNKNMEAAIRKISGTAAAARKRRAGATAPSHLESSSARHVTAVPREKRRLACV